MKKLSALVGATGLQLTDILRSVYENSLDGIVISDPNTIILTVNDAYCAMTGYSSEELVGQKTNVIRAGITPRETFNQMWHALRNEGKWVGELINRRKDGDLWWSYISITRILGADGEVAAYVGIARDITERKKMEDALRDMDRMKSEFIATVSHELRSPMTSIKGSLGLALAGAAGPVGEDLRDLLGIAQNNIERLIGLINDILDLSRGDAGKLSLHITPVDLKQVVSRTVSELYPLAAQKSVRVAVALPEVLPEVAGDQDRLSQVLVNLISNAIKFSDADSQVTIGAEDTGKSVLVWVRDEGVGINREDLPKVFERFHRVDNGDNRRTGGTGLGLAICRAIIQEHGGEIWADSEPGKGSTFSFTLLPAHRVLQR